MLLDERCICSIDSHASTAGISLLKNTVLLLWSVNISECNCQCHVEHSHHTSFSSVTKVKYVPPIEKVCNKPWPTTPLSVVARSKNANSFFSRKTTKQWHISETSSQKKFEGLRFSRNKIFQRIFSWGQTEAGLDLTCLAGGFFFSSFLLVFKKIWWNVS